MAKSKKVKAAGELKETFKFDEKFPVSPAQTAPKRPAEEKAGWYARWKLRKERKRVKKILNHKKDGYHPAFMQDKYKTGDLDRAIERLESSAPTFDEIEKPINVEPLEVLKRRGVKTHTTCKKWNCKNFEDHLHVLFSNGQELTVIPQLIEKGGALHLELQLNQGNMPDKGKD